MPTIDVCDINQIFEEQRVVQSIRAFQATVSFLDSKISRRKFLDANNLEKFFNNFNAGGLLIFHFLTVFSDSKHAF